MAVNEQREKKRNVCEEVEPSGGGLLRHLTPHHSHNNPVFRFPPSVCLLVTYMKKCRITLFLCFHSSPTFPVCEKSISGRVYNILNPGFRFLVSQAIFIFIQQLRLG